MEFKASFEIRQCEDVLSLSTEYRTAGLPHCYNARIRNGKTVGVMRQKTLIGFLLLTLPGLVLAQTVETQCTYNDMVRRVVIMSEPLVSVPCEVHYFKDTEEPGSDQVLWSASQQEGYCEEKAAAFVTKLEGWGWDCETTGAAAPAAPAEPAAAPAPAEAPETPAEAPEAPEAPAEAASSQIS